jgi:hypothetical protein
MYKHKISSRFKSTYQSDFADPWKVIKNYNEIMHLDNSNNNLNVPHKIKNTNDDIYDVNDNINDVIINADVNDFFEEIGLTVIDNGNVNGGCGDGGCDDGGCGDIINLTDSPEKLRTDNKHILFIHIANTYSRGNANNRYQRRNPNDLYKCINPIINKCRETLLKSTINFEEVINTNDKDFTTQIINIASKYHDANKDIHHIILLYSGHGYYSQNDMVAGIFTENFQKIQIPQIINYFDYIENVYLIFDACRVNRASPINNDHQIKNDKVIMLYPSAKGHVTSGGNITYGLIDALEERIKLGIVMDNKNLLNVMIDTVNNFNKRVSTYEKRLPRFQPKVYANNKMRDVDNVIFNKLIQTTDQDLQSVAITEINANIGKEKTNVYKPHGSRYGSIYGSGYNSGNSYKYGYSRR